MCAGTSSGWKREGYQAIDAGMVNGGFMFYFVMAGDLGEHLGLGQVLPKLQCPMVWPC